MTRGAGAEGTAPPNSFYGEMRLVPGMLYAYVEGKDDEGMPFERVLSTVFEPVMNGTGVTGCNSTDIFQG